MTEDEFPTRAQMDTVARLSIDAHGTTMKVTPVPEDRLIEVVNVHGIRHIVDVDGNIAMPDLPAFVHVQIPRDLAEAMIGADAYEGDARAVLQRGTNIGTVPFAMRDTAAAIIAAIRDEFNVPEPEGATA